jgi:hypothetical protein
MKEQTTYLQLRKEARKLISTSVEDMQSSLRFVEDIEILELALRIANFRSYKTKANLLKAKVNKMQRGKTK